MNPASKEEATRTVAAPLLVAIADALAPLATAANAGERASSIGRYLPIEEIGRGGMGVVLRAYDPKLRREVALKSLLPTTAGAEAPVEDARRLLREAQAMAKLAHVNVVAVYDVEAHGECVVLAMEYVPGTTLKSWLACPRPWRSIVGMFIAAGRGLAAAHAVGLLHRDFKPANVLVGEDGRVRVTDFGLARRTELDVSTETVPPGSPAGSLADVTHAGVILGTPRYMAPEQFDGEALTAAADQFAFCVALWEALTGQPPFATNDLQAARESRRGGPPPWPRDATRLASAATPGRLVPRAIAAAITRGLAADPEARWPSMDALLERLSVHPEKPHRRWAAAVATVAVIGGAAASWHGHQARLAERCTGASEQLTDVWDGQRRVAVEHAILTTGVSYAADVWQRLASELDDYASAWKTMHAAACQATTVLGEQSPEIMDLRMACLHRARISLRAVTELFAVADAGAVEKAHAVVASLPDLRRCADVTALQAAVAPPQDSDREAVEAVRVALAEVTAGREAGRYPENLARATALAQTARGIAYRPVQAEVLIELALALANSGKHEESQETFREALRSALSAKQWELAAQAATGLVGIIGSRQTRPLEGLAFAETAKGLHRQTSAATQAELHHAIGAALHAQGRYSEAEAEYRDGLTLAEEAGNQPLVALFRGSLGITLNYQGRWSEAEVPLHARLQLNERLLGAEHPDTSLARFDLAVVHRGLGRYDESEAGLRRALASWEKSLGEQHLYCGLARSGLALTVLVRGRAEEARAEYERALEILRRHLGPEHELVVDTQVSLGRTLMQLGDYERAEHHIRAARQVSEKLRGADHPETTATRDTLSTLLILQGRYVEAETEARLAEASVRKAAGDGALLSFVPYNNLGAALKGQGRYREAETQLRTALSLAERAYGSGHALVGQVHNSIGTVLAAQARYVEAEAEHRISLAVQSQALGADHTDVAFSRGRLANALRALQRHGEAEQEYREALTVQEKAKGAEHPALAELHAGLGRTLIEQRRGGQARPLLEAAWTRWQDDARVMVPVRAELAFRLAIVLWTTSSERSRARMLARKARALLDGSPERTPERAELERWLHEHG